MRTSADFYHFYSLLTKDERELCERTGTFIDQEVNPIISSYWERGELPFEVLPKLAKLDISGDTIQGYGCPGIKRPAAGPGVCGNRTRRTRAWPPF
ncbi:MAG: acyl-CoA dehydrogenase family protein [Ktedonobacteraceae bacterium]